jgi:hypothetical protein
MRKILPRIGWREWLALPDLGIHLVKAKVDTGARTSSLHAFDVEMRKHRKGRVVLFKVCPFQRDNRRVVHCQANLHDERWVTSSDGKKELRPVIRTTLSLFDSQWPVELTLTSRDTMGFRMLLGRESIRERFVVDPGRSFLSGRRRKRMRGVQE